MLVAFGLASVFLFFFLPIFRSFFSLPRPPPTSVYSTSTPSPAKSWALLILLQRLKTTAPPTVHSVYLSIPLFFYSCFPSSYIFLLSLLHLHTSTFVVELIRDSSPLIARKHNTPSPFLFSSSRHRLRSSIFLTEHHITTFANPLITAISSLSSTHSVLSQTTALGSRLLGHLIDSGFSHLITSQQSNCFGCWNIARTSCFTIINTCFDSLLLHHL